MHFCESEVEDEGNITLYLALCMYIALYGSPNGWICSALMSKCPSILTVTLLMLMCVTGVVCHWVTGVVCHHTYILVQDQDARI